MDVHIRFFPCLLTDKMEKKYSMCLWVSFLFGNAAGQVANTSPCDLLVVFLHINRGLWMLFTCSHFYHNPINVLDNIVLEYIDRMYRVLGKSCYSIYHLSVSSVHASCVERVNRSKHGEEKTVARVWKKKHHRFPIV